MELDFWFRLTGTGMALNLMNFEILVHSRNLNKDLNFWFMIEKKHHHKCLDRAEEITITCP